MPLGAPFFLLLLFAFSSAHAESVAVDELRKCGALQWMEERDACFKALIPAEVTEVSEPAGEPVAVPIVPEVNQSEPAVEAEPAVREARITEETGKRYVEPEPENTRTKKIPLAATVVEVTEGNRGILIFTFGNGQVWRQQSPTTFRYPRSGPFDVEIKQGLMGDYQMRVNGKGRMTRIVRVQ